LGSLMCRSSAAAVCDNAIIFDDLVYSDCKTDPFSFRNDLEGMIDDW
jgi:hypothetical protein